MNQELIKHFEALGFNVYTIEPDNYNKLWRYSITRKDRGNCEDIFQKFHSAEILRSGYSEIILIDGDQELRDEYWKSLYNSKFGSILYETFTKNRVDYYTDKLLKAGVHSLVARIIQFEDPKLCKRIGEHKYNV